MRAYYEIEGIASIELEAAFRPATYNVTSIIVETGYQGLGIGSALMRAVMKDAGEAGVSLWLIPASIEKRDEDLIRFYERLGFRALGARCGHWTWGLESNARLGR